MTDPQRPRTDLTRMERGEPLTDAEISSYLADRQTAIRHGTADIGTEIAEQLRDRLAAYPGAWSGWTPPWVATLAAPAGLREALERFYPDATSWHFADCPTARYPGGPFDPPDPCMCGGPEIRPALEAASIAATPIETFGRAVGLVLAERKVPEEWDADNLTPVQMIEATVTLLDRLDDATDEYLAAKGSDHRIDRAMQRSLREARAALEAAPRSPAPDFVERLARAMEPTWFEDVTALPRPATLSDHDWGQMVLDVHLRRGRAIKRASEIASRLAAAPVGLIDAAEEVVRLGNQPGMDDDEWEAAITALEQALEAAPRSPGPLTALWFTYGPDGGPAHRWDGQEEPINSGAGLAKVAACGFLLDYGLRLYQHVGRPANVEACPRCLALEAAPRSPEPDCTVCHKPSGHDYHRKHGHRTWEPPYHPFYPPASPETPEAGIDVERLARAMQDIHLVDGQREAEFVARRLAVRLSKEARETPEVRHD